LLLRDATGHVYSAVLLALLVTGVSIWIAYRDVKISARLMLWIEALSVTVILVMVVLLLVRHGWHWDWDELHLRGMTGSGLRLGLVLALFSFVGFESATTLVLRRAIRCSRFPARSFKARFSPGFSSRFALTRKCWAFTLPGKTWVRAKPPCVCWPRWPAAQCWEC